MSRATRKSLASPEPRRRLLEVTGPLFHQAGVGTGVDTVCRAAGVSKRTLYQLFAHKDERVAAALDHGAPQLHARVLPGAGDAPGPRGRILYVFAALRALSAALGWRGCPFVATVFEVKDPGHPAAGVARRHKQVLTDFSAAEAAAGGAADPWRLAVQLTVVHDGAMARAVMRAEPLDAAAFELAELLVDVAGVTDGAPAPPA